jgi:Fe-S-cluster containining protein
MGIDHDIVVEDTRDALELGADENAELCAGCSRCCETVSIEVDAPRAPWEYDQWIWVLHHQNLELYVEKPERWYLHIETRCRQLGDDRRCRIYGRHPVLCREYDPRGCERRAPLSDVVAWFKCAEDLERWLQERRPAHWKRLLAHRREAPPAKDAGALVHALVSIAEPAAHEPATKLRQARPRR